MTTDKASSEYSRQLEAIAARNHCFCGKLLSVAWIDGAYHLRCGAGHINEETVRVKSDWQLWKEGILVDPYRDQEAMRKREREERRR